MSTNGNTTRPRQEVRQTSLRVLAIAMLAGSATLGCGTADSSTDAESSSAPVAADSPEVAATSEQVAQTDEPETVGEIFPPGPGKALVLDNCGSCHAVACSALGQRTSARWDSLKDGHREHVSSLSTEDIDTIFGYLKENFNDAKPEPDVPAIFLAAGCTPF